MSKAWPKDKREKYLNRCRKRIEGSKRFRQNEGYDDLWKRLIDLYRGKHFERIGSEDRIAINLAFANINTIWSSISTNYPKISVNARNPDDQDAAVVTEAIINYWWRTKEIKPEIQLASKESLILGHGFVKTGYRYVEEQQPKSPDELQGEYDTMRQEADLAAADNPDTAALLPTDEEIMAAISDTKAVPVHDAPFVERVSPFDVYVDPEATSLRDAKWIAQRVYRSIEDVKKDKKYKASRADAEPDSMVDEAMRPMDSSDKDKEFRRCSVYEYYDLINGTMCVFSEKGKDFLVDPVDQPYAFGHPFVMIRNHEIPGKFYPMGEVEAIEDLQIELDKTRSQMLNHRKKGNRKYLYHKSSFSSEALSSLTSDVDGEAVAVNEGVLLNEAIIPLPINGIDAQLYQWSDQIQADINSISGVTEYQRGGQDQNIRRSATEASIIADAANARASEKLAQFELVNSEVARRLVMLAQQYMTNEEAIRITDSQGQPVWGKVEPDFIKGEFDYEVESGSTKPKNEAYLMQQASQMLEMLNGIPNPQVVNWAEVAKLVLEQGLQIKDGSRFIIANPPVVDPATGQPMSTDTPPAPGGGEQAPPSEPGADEIPPELLAQLIAEGGAPVG